MYHQVPRTFKQLNLKASASIRYPKPWEELKVLPTTTYKNMLLLLEQIVVDVQYSSLEFSN